MDWSWGGMNQWHPFPSASWELKPIPDHTLNSKLSAFDYCRCPIAEYCSPRNLVAPCSEALFSLDYLLEKPFGLKLVRETTLVTRGEICSYRWCQKQGELAHNPQHWSAQSRLHKLINLNNRAWLGKTKSSKPSSSYFTGWKHWHLENIDTLRTLILLDVDTLSILKRWKQWCFKKINNPSGRSLIRCTAPWAQIQSPLLGAANWVQQSSMATKNRPFQIPAIHVSTC